MERDKSMCPFSPLNSSLYCLSTSPNNEIDGVWKTARGEASYILRYKFASSFSHFKNEISRCPQSGGMNELIQKFPLFSFQ